MKKDYTNKNKKFYENGKIFKIFEIDSIFLIYILNNLDSYIVLVNDFKKLRKDRATPIASRYSLFGYIFLYSSTEIFLEEKMKDIEEFFFNMNNNIFSMDKLYQERILKFLKYCIEKEDFSKDFFIKYFCMEFKNNLNLKRNRQKIDFDSLLALSLDYPILLKLDICSKRTKQEINDIVNYINESNII